MKKLLIFIKSLFKKHETKQLYWIERKKIKVPYYYKKSRINPNKWKDRLDYWHNTGCFKSAIILDKDFNLLDGYSSVKIAYVKGIDVVPVYFSDGGKDIDEIKIFHKQTYAKDS